MTNTIASDTTTGISPANGDRVYIPFGVSVANTASMGIFAEGGPLPTTLDIDGAVIGMDGAGIYAYSGASDQGNFRIDVGKSGVVRSLGAYAAVDTEGTDSTLINQGVLSGIHGALLRGPSDQTVENHGSITGNISAGVEVVLSLGATVINTGTITGSEGVDFSFSSGTLTNLGTITGRSGAAFDGSTATDAITLFNSGTLNAPVDAVKLGADADKLVNRGMIEGNALLGEGNDIYRGRFGAVDGTVEGGNGDDVLNGGLRADSLDGGGGADLLRGRAGDDTLVGGFEDDRLFGGRGDDVIIPGEGVDMMKGGRDNDTFVFESFTDITPTGPTDHILDFRKGADLIDLSQMTPGTFAFSAKGFKGGGRESVTLAVRHGDTLVKIDFDGDGRLDGRFIVDDVKGLSAHDFIL